MRRELKSSLVRWVALAALALGGLVVVPATSAHAASCPVPGQHVKSSTSSAIYLIDPQGRDDYIPNSTVYFNLWDSWSSVITNDNLCLHSPVFTLGAGELAKESNSPKVYIFDSNQGGWRWITSSAVFNKYGFSWAKIRTLSSVFPKSSQNWS